jgi:hypothetical protein
MIVDEYWCIYICADDRDVVEGFIVSAGLDQRVKLWSVDGSFVGEFGSIDTWNVEDRTTWADRKAPEPLSVDIKEKR